MYWRNITHEALEALADSPVLFVRGARQVGKSTLAKDLLADQFPAKYVTLDNASNLAAALDDPTEFIGTQPRPVIIDEIQRAPGLLLAIKEAIDKDRKPGQFLLTGSANLLTLPMVNESLAGRMEILTLWPFSQGELQGRKADFIATLFEGDLARTVPVEHPDIAELIITGGYPEMQARKSAKRREAWFDSYLTTLVERDVRDIARIQETAAMLQLIRMLATRTGKQFSQSELSRTLKIPNTTLGRYLGLLEKVFLIHFLPAWATNLGKRLVKTPKMFMVDSGLAAHLVGADNERLRKTPEIAGQLFETYVVNEILKQMGWSAMSVHPYYLRTHAGLEVDLVLERPSGEVACIEIKYSSQVSSKHFKGLRGVQETLGERFRAGVVIYNGSEVVPFGKNLWAVPVGAMWNGPPSNALETQLA